MLDRTSPIGILDSGIGGFSAVRQVQRLLPGEELLYFGDGAHVPYGNHPEETITALSRYMFRFMEERGVKALLVACNTISCVADRCLDLVSCPVFNTVEAGTSAAVGTGLDRVGVISTVFTHRSGLYPARIAEKAARPVRVVSRGCPNLAGLVEHHLGSPEGMPLVEDELRRELAPLTEAGVECCVLGCTHYSLVADSIRLICPGLPLIDPAEELARTLRDCLEEKDLLDPRRKLGGLTICTTGDVEEYALRARQVGLERVETVRAYPPMEL